MVFTITLTGKPSANGKEVSNIKALELAYLLSQYEGKISKKIILAELYNNFCSKNALWYPVKGCSELGVNIEYNPENRVYFTKTEICSDLGIVFSSLEEGDIAKALFYLRGPILPGCQDWFAEHMRDVLMENLRNMVASLDPQQQQTIEINLKLRGVEL